MRVLFVLFLFAGIAAAQPCPNAAKAGACAPPPPPAAVFQAPQQSIRVQVPPPDVQFEFVQPAPTVTYKVQRPVLTVPVAQWPTYTQVSMPVYTYLASPVYSVPVVPAVPSVTAIGRTRLYPTPVRDFFRGK